MQEKEAGPQRKLLLWGTLIVLAHFAIVIWHLVLLMKVQPGMPTAALLLLVLINLIPAAGLILFVKGFHKTAASMIMAPLGVALVIGFYRHFLSAGTDNVLHMPAGKLTLAFQISAMVLAVLEAAGCWIAARMFAADFRRP